MKIRYIKEVKKDDGRVIAEGTQVHVLNEYGKELIEQGIAEVVQEEKQEVEEPVNTKDQKREKEETPKRKGRK